MEAVTASGSGSAARRSPRPLVHVPGARSHAHELRGLLARQEHRVLERAARGEREVRRELRVEAVRLVVGHRQQSERPDELVEVAGGRGDGEERAARREDARHLIGLRGANTLSTRAADPVTERERLPRVRADGRGALVRASGAAQGGGGGVDGDAARVRKRVEHRGEMVARARTEVDDGAARPRPTRRPPRASAASAAPAAGSGPLAGRRRGPPPSPACPPCRAPGSRSPGGRCRRSGRRRTGARRRSLRVRRRTRGNAAGPRCPRARGHRRASARAPGRGTPSRA